MLLYNNPEYFFENFKGGSGGGRSGGSGSKGKNKDANDKIKQNIFNIFITLAIIGFLYFINKMFPKQTTAVLKRYEAFDYMNHYVYLIIAIITIILLYIIISAFL
jgi:choline-glycine betaine transporter